MSNWVLAHIITKLELGGAQLATLHEVAHSRFGERPHYLLYGPGGLLDAQVASLPDVVGVPIDALGRSLHALDDARAVLQIYRALVNLRRLHPRASLLVHTHSSKAGIVGRWAARLCGAERIVHSVHGFGHQPDMPRPLFYALWASERVTGAITDGFTADSAANLLRGRAEHLWSADKPTRVVHCGIDVDAFATAPTHLVALRAALGITADAPVVLMVACLKPQKDPMTFLDVAQRVRRVVPNCVFLLAGDGAMRAALQTRIEALGLQASVRLLGWRRDVPALLHTCDMLLLTSRWEGLPQVFAQAMAACKPIVATNVDGNAEAVTHGQTGFLCAPGDAEGLAQAVLKLVNTPLLRQSMGRAGRARADDFSEQTMVATLDGFYESLMD